MGFSLEEFIGHAGFEPFGSALYKLGSGGNGLIIACNYQDEASAKAGAPCLMVFVCRVDGYSVIRRSSHAAAHGLPMAEDFPNTDPTPGAAQQLTVPPDGGTAMQVHAWGGGAAGS